METRYTVRQTVEMTGVKSYVLRYWEEELELQIHRNELGHRYYTGYDIQLFLNIKELKRRGLAASRNQKTDSSDHCIHERIRRKRGGIAGRCCRGHIGRCADKSRRRYKYRKEDRYRQSRNTQ